MERFWRGFGEDLGRFGVLEKFSRKGLEEAPSPGRGPEGPEETQMRQKRPEKARRGPRPRKRWEEVQTPTKSPEEVEKRSRSPEKARREYFKGLGKVLKGFGEVLERF